MSFFALIFKSAFRNQLRTGLTAMGVAIAVIAFLIMRTFVAAWYGGVEGAQSDRMIVRNKTSIIFSMPLNYVDKVRNIVGDKGVVSYENWIGAIYPKDEHGFFGNLAIDDDVFKMYPEIVIPPDQWKEYTADRMGAVVGWRLAEKYGWKIGDKITLRGTIYPGDWDFNIRALYKSTSKAVDEASMFFHWKYFNEKLEERGRDQIGIILIKVNDPSQSTALGQEIDRRFANSAAETRTESEKAFQLEFFSMVSTILTAIQVVSFVVLLILMLILANTMAMSTRERTTEYAVMRAIGFRSSHVVWMVIGEGLVIAALGATLGIALSVPLLKFFAQIFQEKMGAWLGGFDLELRAVALAVVVALNLGWIAASLPAARAGRLKIADALRRVE
jgi:putative ABC transport system permease protein